MSIAPEHYHRRSPVYARLTASGAVFTDSADTAVASAYPERATPALGLVDLSAHPRTGVKGPSALAWLDEQRWPVPQGNNVARSNEAGDVVLRLGDREVLIVARPDGAGAAVRTLDAAIPGGGAWHVPRRDSHCGFLIRGDTAAACLAKLCAIDLRETSFPRGSIAQTSLARLHAVICRMPGGSTDGFLLLADSACAIWLWDTVLDAMAEFGGGPLGVDEIG